MKTKERLVLALRYVGAPESMIKKAADGYYDDFESPIATPSIELVVDLRALGLSELASRAMNGEFDATREEADAWGQSEEGQKIIRELGK